MAAPVGGENFLKERRLSGNCKYTPLLDSGLVTLDSSCTVNSIKMAVLLEMILLEKLLIKKSIRQQVFFSSKTHMHMTYGSTELFSSSEERR